MSETSRNGRWWNTRFWPSRQSRVEGSSPDSLPSYQSHSPPPPPYQSPPHTASIPVPVPSPPARRESFFDYNDGLMRTRRAQASTRRRSSSDDASSRSGNQRSLSRLIARRAHLTDSPNGSLRSLAISSRESTLSTQSSEMIFRISLDGHDQDSAPNARSAPHRPSNRVPSTPPDMSPIRTVAQQGTQCRFCYQPLQGISLQVHESNCALRPTLNEHRTSEEHRPTAMNAPLLRTDSLNVTAGPGHTSTVSCTGLLRRRC